MMIENVDICGIRYDVILCSDLFDADTHFGQIDYKQCTIRINEDMSERAQTETLCHEILHGILNYLGYTEHSENEQFVQALGNAINQSFTVKKGGEDE
ncbi:MAG: ImmA/IrrE family metallo-endopeptidase [Lachnospiraceae bacterium]|nr:ImmA/IrrE family metallo-endopeptidase [Lachnospiraceae bacterium]